MLFPVIDFVRPEPVRFETNAFLFIPLFVVFYQASIASRWTITLQKRLSPLASALWQSPRGRSSGKTRHGSRDTVARITSIRFSRSPIRSRSIIRGDRIIVDGTLGEHSGSSSSERAGLSLSVSVSLGFEPLTSRCVKLSILEVRRTTFVR